MRQVFGYTKPNEFLLPCRRTDERLDVAICFPTPFQTTERQALIRLTEADLVPGTAATKPITNVVEFLTKYSWRQEAFMIRNGGGSLQPIWVIGVEREGRLYELRPLVYPASFGPRVDESHLLRPAAKHPDVVLALSEWKYGPNSARERHRKPSGYLVIEIRRRVFFFHPSRAGVLALFQLCEVEFTEGILRVDPEEVGGWIGIQGFNAHRLAECIGVPFIQVLPRDR
jgi:hypothetical protein